MKQSHKLIPAALFKSKPNNQHLDFANPTATDLRNCSNRACATLNDLDHHIWPWRWPCIINFISEMDSGGQDYMEKWYYYTFQAYYCKSCILLYFWYADYMLISYYANKKSSSRLPSWQPSLISFNTPIDSRSIIKPCTLKLFQVPILAPGLLPQLMVICHASIISTNFNTKSLEFTNNSLRKCPDIYCQPHYAMAAILVHVNIR